MPAALSRNLTTMPKPTSQIRAICLLALMSLLAATACRSTASLPAASLADGPAPSAGTEARLRSDIAYLADDAREGRETGTPGNDSSAAYLARRYAGMGVPSPLPGADPAACRLDVAASACVNGYLQHFSSRSAADAHSGRPARSTQNVVAVVPGSDPGLRGQILIIGAHFDHLGRSTDGALDPQAGDAIRNGADDNASGTAAVLELARRFAAHPARRTVMLVNFTAEEQGLLGSAYFAANSPLPLDSVQAMMNFDMVGRLRNDRLIVYGTGTAAALPDILESANSPTNGDPALDLSPVPDGYGPSDHSSFYARNIPVLHFFTDVHDDYHRATDDAALVNYAGIVRVVDYAERVARNLADRPDRLPVIAATQPAPVAGSARKSGGDVYFGSVPDMGAGTGKGMHLSGVTPGSPADKAGIRTDDIIIEFGGTPIDDLYSYTDALRSHKPGDSVKVVVLRAGQRLEMTAVLVARGDR